MRYCQRQKTRGECLAHLLLLLECIRSLSLLLGARRREEGPGQRGKGISLKDFLGRGKRPRSQRGFTTTSATADGATEKA